MKINDDLLPVIVSTTEPTGEKRKKIWKQHSGKNLLKCKNNIVSPVAAVTVATNYTGEILNYINVTKSSSVSSNIFIELSSFVFEYNTGNYILSGCPNGGSFTTYQLYLRDITLGTDVSPRDEGSGAIVFLIKGNQYRLYLRIDSNAIFTNKRFYPMLRLSTETNSNYEPYIDDKEYILNTNNIYKEFKKSMTEYEILDKLGIRLIKIDSICKNFKITINRDKSYVIGFILNADGDLYEFHKPKNGNLWVQSYVGSDQLTGTYSDDDGTISFTSSRTSIYFGMYIN